MPPVTVEEIPEEDNASSYTFPVPSPPELLVDDDESEASQVEFDEDVPDPLDDVPVLPEEDELLAPGPGSFDGDGYPRPSPPAGFVNRMGKEAARPGRVRVAPTVSAAAEALAQVNVILRGESRGKNGGYKKPDFDGFVLGRLQGMRAMLSYYTDNRSLCYEKWGKSALQAAIGMCRGNHCARVLARLCRQFIADGTVLPINPYGSWCVSMLADEDLAEDIHLHLQQLGNYITAEGLMKYLHHPEVKLKHGIDRDILETTARRYLHDLGYRFAFQKKGQYSDGHERSDVVYYRDHVYIPRLFSLLETSYHFESDGTLIIPPSGRHRTVIWYHDESIFYAHD